MRPVVLLLALPVVLVACTDDGTSLEAGDEPAHDQNDQRYEAVATVLESPQHGPQLCVGLIATSLPPQCGGPDVEGWDWNAVDGEETAIGTTWGHYRVVGTYVDGVFTLTEPAVEAGTDVGSGDGMEVDFTTPCPEPEGGWTVVDPATATLAGQEAANQYAMAQPEYAGLWVDDSINPHAGIGPGEEDEYDPTDVILNVRFTEALQRHAEELRSRWGGPLCVTDAVRTHAELRAIQDELTSVRGFLSSGVDVIDGVVDLQVIVDDGIQGELDKRYGRGVVDVNASLRPLD